MTEPKKGLNIEKTWIRRHYKTAALVTGVIVLVYVVGVYCGVRIVLVKTLIKQCFCFLKSDGSFITNRHLTLIQAGYLCLERITAESI